MARSGPRPGKVYEMAAHLLLADTAFSKNRNFEAYEDPRFKSAIALYRRLRALMSDLERACADGHSRAAVVEETHAGRPSVRLDVVSPRARRTVWLAKPEWDVLMLHAGAQAAVVALTRRVAA